jgi:hypothetical protein
LANAQTGAVISPFETFGSWFRHFDHLLTKDIRRHVLAARISAETRQHVTQINASASRMTFVPRRLGGWVSLRLWRKDRSKGRPIE